MFDRLCPDKDLSWRYSAYDVVPWGSPIESLGAEELCSSLMYPSRTKVVPSHRSRKIPLLILTFEPCISLHRGKVVGGSLVEKGDHDKGGGMSSSSRKLCAPKLLVPADIATIRGTTISSANGGL